MNQTGNRGRLSQLAVPPYLIDKVRRVIQERPESASIENEEICTRLDKRQEGTIEAKMQILHHAWGCGRVVASGMALEWRHGEPVSDLGRSEVTLRVSVAGEQAPRSIN